MEALTRAFALLGTRGTGLIITALAKGPADPHLIHERVPGLTDGLLTRRLREMTALGLVARTAHPGTPTSTVYTLASHGKALLIPLTALAVWAEDHLPAKASEATRSPQRDRAGADRRSTDLVHHRGGASSGRRTVQQGWRKRAGRSSSGCAANCPSEASLEHKAEGEACLPRRPRVLARSRAASALRRGMPPRRMGSPPPAVPLRYGHPELSALGRTCVTGVDFSSTAIARARPRPGPACRQPPCPGSV
ncbi:helix-turn-helix transcriptional regulator [Streptomyces actinomycinicus]|uniref:Helix-turn-helix transcriptional regulator n=1 Tax=Streptomyces actinomycinicus TaxID=1695166 RepID=A0A937JP58_9ACTN|nr:helix-turn-helix transcriptional regulator [Streptomyces actinomycinicus]